MENRASEANDEALREKAREAVQSGRVPGRRPDRVLGGVGRQRTCVVCNQMITLTQMEIEAEFPRNGIASESTCYWFHPRFFTAWEARPPSPRSPKAVIGVFDHGPAGP